MIMIEFGSVFHFVDSYNSEKAHLTDMYREAILLADGRQCLVELVRQYGWKRIWMPDYFCYEVIDTLKEQTGIEVMFYEDSPQYEGHVDKLPFNDGDVLLRMNYFGMRGKRSNKETPVPVIEDHSHDLLGPWALFSDADWCIASLRKTLPIPIGGILWSPKGGKIQGCPSDDSTFARDKSNKLGFPLAQSLSSRIKVGSSEENIASERWKGMEMKAHYLKGEDVCKDEFRKHFTETEEWFDKAEPMLIDERSREFVSKQLDINLWQGAKRRNWKLLKLLIQKKGCTIMKPESDACTMFSMVLLMYSKVHRDALRKRLIERCVYPAILWDIPNGASEASRDFSERMLSIHCDGRYTEDDVRQLATIINESL